MNILATGMVSAVGFSAAASCAAIRAKVAGMREWANSPPRGSEVVGAAVPDIAVEPDARLVDLLSIAIKTVWKRAAFPSACRSCSVSANPDGQAAAATRAA